jgi:hypothetical protein
MFAVASSGLVAKSQDPHIHERSHDLNSRSGHWLPTGQQNPLPLFGQTARP